MEMLKGFPVIPTNSPAASQQNNIQSAAGKDSFVESKGAVSIVWKVCLPFRSEEKDATSERSRTHSAEGTFRDTK